MIEKKPKLLKVVLMGEAQTGKTQIMTRFVFNEFKAVYEQSTCIDFEAKSLTNSNGQLFEVQIWDTCGQDSMLVIPYIKDVNVIGVVVDASLLLKATNLSEWFSQVKKGFPEIPICLFVNKTDLVTQFDETYKHEVYQKLPIILRESDCDSEKIPIFFCSAKTGRGIKEAFQTIVSSFIENRWQSPCFKIERETSNTHYLSIGWHRVLDTLSRHKFWVGGNLALIVGIIIGLIVASCLMGSVFIFGFPLSALAVSAMMGGSALLLWNIACVVRYQFLKEEDNKIEQIDHDPDGCWEKFVTSHPEQKTTKTELSFQPTTNAHQKPEIERMTHRHEVLTPK